MKKTNSNLQGPKVTNNNFSNKTNHSIKSKKDQSRSIEYINKHKINSINNNSPYNITATSTTSIFNRTLNAITPTWIKNGVYISENYIGFNRKDAYRTALLFSFVSISAVNSYFIFQNLQHARSNFHGLLESGEYTAEEFHKTFFKVIKAIAIYIGGKIAAITCSELLTNSITIQMKMDLVQAWIKSGTYNGINYLTQKNSPVYVVAHDVYEYVYYTIHFLQDLIEASSSFLLALTSLYSLLNNELSITCLLLVLTIKLAAAYCGNFVKELLSKIATLKEKEISDFHDINKFSESIALSGGAAYEEKILLGNIEEALACHNKSVLFSNVNNFIQELKGFGSWAVGTYLCKEKLIAKTMNMGDAFSIGDALQSLIVFFTFIDAHASEDVSAQTAFARIVSVYARIIDWNKALNERDEVFKLTQSSTNDVAFDGIIKKPNGEVLFQGALNLEAGKVYQLVGPSGIGKSTVIRALAGLWPYVEGKLTMPKNTHIIPQTSYVKGGDTSLLDIIRYPKTDKPTNTELKLIKTLMKDLGFSSDSDKLIHLKDQSWTDTDGKPVKAQWSFTLSGGERQRIAIISAIIKNPQFLILDEGTSALDPDLKVLGENALKKYLPKSALLFVDHNPSGLFAENLRPEWFIKNQDPSALSQQPRLMITHKLPLEEKIINQIKSIIPKTSSVLSINAKRFADKVITVGDFK